MKDLENLIAKCESNAIPDSQIDLSDIPELTDEDFKHGYFKNLKTKKKTVTFRIDLDNLAWLKQDGAKGYQTKLNEVLRWARYNNCPVVSE